MGSKKKKTRVVPIKEEDKGNPIRFSGGKYAGLTGWLEKMLSQRLATLR